MYTCVEAQSNKESVLSMNEKKEKEIKSTNTSQIRLAKYKINYNCKAIFRKQIKRKVNDRISGEF